jgi:hypothetical protein
LKIFSRQEAPLGKFRKHNPDAATRASLDAIARGAEIEAVKIPVSMILLQKSRAGIEALCLIPVEAGGLERVHDGRTALITMASIKNRQEMIKANKLEPVHKPVPPRKAKAKQEARP